jgi:hypothetical protein
LLLLTTPIETNKYKGNKNRVAAQIGFCRVRALYGKAVEKRGI